MATKTRATKVEWDAKIESEVKYCRHCGNEFIVVKEWYTVSYYHETGNVERERRTLACPRRNKWWWDFKHDKVLQWRNPRKRRRGFEYQESHEYY